MKKERKKIEKTIAETCLENGICSRFEKAKDKFDMELGIIGFCKSFEKLDGDASYLIPDLSPPCQGKYKNIKADLEGIFYWKDGHIEIEVREEQ